MGQAHTQERLGWHIPTNDSREWMRILDHGDVLNYQRVVASPEIVSKYDLVFVELTPATHRVPKLIKMAAPAAFCIGLVEGRVEYVLRTKGDMEGLLEFWRCVSTVDMLGILVERTLPYYRLYSDRPKAVQWLGVPYPKDWTDAMGPSTWSPGPIIELGSAMDSRNGIANVLVMKRLQRQFPALKTRIYAFLPRERQMVSDLGVMKVEWRQPKRWPDYYREHSEVFAVLCLDDRRTWGRYALDSASAWMPFVGSNLSHCGEKVGVLTCDPFDTEAAVEYLSELITEALEERCERRRQVTEQQYSALRAYDSSGSRERLSLALAACGAGELAAAVATLNDRPPLANA